MKNRFFWLGASLIGLLVGCTTNTTVRAPVGPNPTESVSDQPTGRLEVFSALEKCRDGNDFDPDPAWHQHTDYTVYTGQGKRVRHVFNTVGHYEEAPRVIRLPPGEYFVKARAQGYLLVTVPVIIQAGRTTRLHLDAAWNPPRQLSKAHFVSMPGGYDIGWSGTYIGTR